MSTPMIQEEYDSIVNSENSLNRTSDCVVIVL